MAELGPEAKSRLYIASGSVDTDLTNRIAEVMGVEAGPVDRHSHPNGESYVRFENNVRTRDVIIVQSHARSDFGSPNDAWAEQFPRGLDIHDKTEKTRGETQLVCKLFCGHWIIAELDTL
jgi:hypothetical protein